MQLRPVEFEQQEGPERQNLFVERCMHQGAAEKCSLQWSRCTGAEAVDDREERDEVTEWTRGQDPM